MERDNLDDLGLDGRIILKYIFKTWNGKATHNTSQQQQRWTMPEAVVTVIFS